MEESAAELLTRLQPVLKEIFAAYDIAEEPARRIVEETFAILISKRWDRQNPGRWLLRTLIERCRSLALETGDSHPGDRPQ
jgi:hypothetical protein